MTTSLNKIYNLISEFNELLWNNRKWEGISEYFVVFEGEDVDTYRPNYDYEETQKEIAEIKKYLRYLNTVINKTKANLFIEEYGINLDELEMYRDDLKRRINALDNILAIKTESEEDIYGVIIETCPNYDEERIRKEKDEINIELDRVKNTICSIYNAENIYLEGSESQWEDIIKDKTQLLDSIIDKELWKEHDRIERELYEEYHWYRTEGYRETINPRWWEHINWWH